MTFLRSISILRVLSLFAVILATVASAHAYSVLSHEEVVDMAWPQYLLPLLQQRYPGLTPDQITECHAYAYGGSVIQDIGYYPFGDREFSNLLHYARSGDFVTAMLRDASTPDEFAFALGSLAHYYGDTIGHPYVNVITGEEYPKLETRFGRIVTYGDNETAHLRTEFGFDVVEVAHGAYSQENYRDFIGFQVAKPLLNRAFEETYGLPIDDVLKHEDLAISTYRWSISTLIPRMTKVALAGYGKQIQTANPGFAKKKFIYRMRRTEFEQKYGHQRTRPNFGERLVAIVLAIIPKVGPFSALKLHLPNGAQQSQFLASVDKVEDSYRVQIKAVGEAPPDAPPALPQLDFDTGKPTTEGEYALADKTYAFLVEKLADDKQANLTAPLITHINQFYATGASKDALQAKPKDWARLQASLVTLRQKPLAPPQPLTPTSVTPSSAQ